MIEWLILVLNLATAVPTGGNGIAESVIAPMPGTAGAVYAIAADDDYDDRRARAIPYKHADRESAGK